MHLLHIQALQWNWIYIWSTCDHGNDQKIKILRIHIFFSLTKLKYSPRSLLWVINFEKCPPPTHTRTTLDLKGSHELEAIFLYTYNFIRNFAESNNFFNFEVKKEIYIMLLLTDGTEDFHNRFPEEVRRSCRILWCQRQLCHVVCSSLLKSKSVLPCIQS